MKRKTPEGASFAQEAEGAMLFAPSADRNLAPIAKELAEIAPGTGDALEIASGTGQHIVAHAAAHPQVHWHPSEIDEDRIASVNAYIAQSGLTNVSRAIELDATASGWATEPAYDLILLSNLLHLISDQEAQTILTEAALALRSGGKFMVYGPFMRGGVLTSEGDHSFHTSLQAQDPDIGYKDDEWVQKIAAAVGLTVDRVTDMPANNLAFTFLKP
ncbi:DUF938 domain-containing protein [Cognatishimia sp.]|uniref:DUF938 domain-containing protein n=1 Tax=Cognatishimia sp. TaxID=2211648 RepID=UPI0035199BA7